MEIKKFLIAGGNLTALVYNCPSEQRRNVVNDLLKEVEQVAFVSQDEFPKIEMMGDELCINATIAFAFTLQKEGKLITSGVEGPVAYKNDEKFTTIKVPMKFKKEGNVVLFEGMGFAFFDKKDKPEIEKEEVVEISKKYKLPAFGVILYDENKIYPRVYVKKVDSFVKERACGSGSIAFAALKGLKDVIQPTGEAISVEFNELIEISAKITEIK